MANQKNVSITNSRYLVKNFLREKLVKCIKETSGKAILDVGCGEKPYKGFFQEPNSYVGIDRRAKTADVKSIGEFLPFVDSSFDTVLCTQVLEHVENSEKVLSEFNRILEDNGVLILSTHGVWVEDHEPTDYWRWTLTCLKKIFEAADFEVLETYTMDSVSSLIQIVCLYFPRRGAGKVFHTLLNLGSKLFKSEYKKPKIFICHILKARKMPR